MSAHVQTGSRFIQVAHPALTGNEKRYVNECLDSGWISSAGSFLPRFEEAFAEFCGTRFAISANNGTTALHLALLGLGVGPGDEVLVPTLTYVATANAVHYCGARPVFIDSEPLTMNLDPELIEDRITPATRGIIVVHLYGHPADMDPILEIARRRKLFVIEDAAESHGALYRNRTVGSLGDVATFSFFGNKIITTGEGGMLTTDNPELNQRIRLFRGQGMDPGRRYWFPIVGYNYRMTNIEAALGLAQLEQVHHHLAARQTLARWYSEHLTDLTDVLILPEVMDWAQHAWWMYTVVLRDGGRETADAARRDAILAGLAKVGIETRPVFFPMHVMPPFYEERQYPVAQRLAALGFNLPTHELLTENDVEYIASSLRKLVRA